MYLKTSPDVTYQRMLSRARPEEVSVPMTYLMDLDRLHDEWLLGLQQRNMAEM